MNCDTVRWYQLLSVHQTSLYRNLHLACLRRPRMRLPSHLVVVPVYRLIDQQGSWSSAPVGMPRRVDRPSLAIDRDHLEIAHIVGIGRCLRGVAGGPSAHRRSPWGRFAVHKQCRLSARRSATYHPSRSCRWRFVERVSSCVMVSHIKRHCETYALPRCSAMPRSSRAALFPEGIAVAGNGWHRCTAELYSRSSTAGWRFLRVAGLRW